MKSDSELSNIIEDGCFDECGYMKIPTMATYKQFARTIILHYVVYNYYAELSQLREGLLHTLEFFKVIEAHPTVIRSLLIPGKNMLTAAIIQDLFKIEFSEEGSNNRKREETVIMFLFDFLQLCEGMRLCVMQCSCNFHKLTCSQVIPRMLE